MSIKYLDRNKWHLFVRVRVAGRVIGKKQTFTGTKTEARDAELALIKELACEKQKVSTPRSLKLQTFGDVLKFWAGRTTAKTKTLQPKIDRLIEDLGNVRNEKIKESFGDFMDDLKTEKARTWIGEKTRMLNWERERKGKPAIIRDLGDIIKPRTRNFYLDVAKRAYNFAVKRDKLKENPLKGYDKEKETSRDRVLSEDERKALFDVMVKRKSYLYWAFYFSITNPIRKGDLIGLKKENFMYNQFHPAKSFISFLPQKTGRSKPIEAQLICIDQALLDYLTRLPVDCPHLFPRIDEKGRWHSLGDFKREWKAVLREAKVTGLTWHDLKHCAITWMLDAGFSELELKNLGIQYSAEMIARYYHKDPAKAQTTWDRIRDNIKPVIPACDPLAQKTA